MTASDNTDQPTRAWGFDAAYATALLASLVSSGLTYAYVGSGATELNPVLRWVIASVGLGGMVVVKTAVLVGCYWGYHALSGTVCARRTVVAFAWLGALVNVLDAGHDVRVVLEAGVLPRTDPVVLAALVVAMAVGGRLLWPPAGRAVPG